MKVNEWIARETAGVRDEGLNDRPKAELTVIKGVRQDERFIHWSESDWIGETTHWMPSARQQWNEINPNEGRSEDANSLPQWLTPWMGVDWSGLNELIDCNWIKLMKCNESNEIQWRKNQWMVSERSGTSRTVTWGWLKGVPNEQPVKPGASGMSAMKCNERGRSRLNSIFFKWRESKWM